MTQWLAGLLLSPTYVQSALSYLHTSTLNSIPQCIVANIDADAQKNKDIAAKYGVASYPTIKFFPSGDDKTPLAYEGGRSEADLVKYLNEQCGTFRAVGGGLNAQVCIFRIGYLSTRV